MTMIRVAIADDHELVREGLRSLLSALPNVTLVGEAANGAEAVAMVERERPDLLIVDLLMPEMDGAEVVAALKQRGSATRVLVLTNYLEPTKMRDALRAGALGYLLKDVVRAELQRAIEAVSAGKPYLHPDVQRQLMTDAFGETKDPLDELTRRERSVLCGIARGQSNKEIAIDLGVSEGTIKSYVSSMLVKLGVSDRTQAALYAVQHGLTFE